MGRALRRGFAHGRPPRPSPVVNAAPTIRPVMLGFDITANAAPALATIVLRYDIVTEPDSASLPVLA